MRITIDINARAKSSPSWESLQAMLRSCMPEGSKLTFVKIERPDRGCNYRGNGRYYVELISTDDQGGQWHHSGTVEIDE